MIFTANDVVGRGVCDSRGRVVGRITAFYRYPSDLEAPWGVAAVTSGRVFKKSTHLVDLSDALIDDGVVVVSYPAEQIDSASSPRPVIGNTLTHEHAIEVLRHYRGSSGPS